MNNHHQRTLAGFDAVNVNALIMRLVMADIAQQGMAGRRSSGKPLQGEWASGCSGPSHYSLNHHNTHNFVAFICVRACAIDQGAPSNTETLQDRRRGLDATAGTSDALR